jgi:hypothetical protein
MRYQDARAPARLAERATRDVTVKRCGFRGALRMRQVQSAREGAECALAISAFA